MSDNDLFDFSRKRPEQKTEKIELRYNRSERLKKAPESVQKLHAGDYTKKPGLFKALFTTPASAFLALAIVVMVPFVIFSKKNSDTKKNADFNLVLDYKLETNTDANDNSSAEIVELAFAQITLEPKTKNYSGENIVCMFFILGVNDIVLGSSQQESIYLGERLILSSPIKVNRHLEDIKAVKAQIEIGDKIFVLKKNL